MPNFSNTSAPREFGELIPKGTIAPMVSRVKRGNYGEGGWLTFANTEKGKSAHLSVEVTVTGGPHKDHKLWARLTVEGSNHSAAIANSFDLLGSILRSGFNFAMSDTSSEALAKLDVGYEAFDGLHFYGKVGLAKGKLANDGSGERWPDKNNIVSGVTKDMSDWPGPIAQDPGFGGPSSSTPSAPAAPIARPSWAQ
jgi:hypothetical protein